MVLTRRQLQEKEQQQQQFATEDLPAMVNGSSFPSSSTSTTTSGSKSSSSGVHHHHSKTLQHQAMEVATATKLSQQQLNGQQGSQPLQQTKAVTPRWVHILLLVFALLTILTIPHPFHPTIQDGPTVRHVFYYGWLTAMSTGLGAIPFLLYPDVGTYWVGISNGTSIYFVATIQCLFSASHHTASIQ